MIRPLTPKGVEHTPFETKTELLPHVIRPLTPKGVEHISGE